MPAIQVSSGNNKTPNFRGVVHPQHKGARQRVLSQYDTLVFGLVVVCLVAAMCILYHRSGRQQYVNAPASGDAASASSSSSSSSSKQALDAIHIRECLSNYPPAASASSADANRRILQFKSGVFCEGYWTSSSSSSETSSPDSFPLKMPVARSESFCGEEPLLRVIDFVEGASPAEAANRGVTLLTERQRGMAHSRLEKDVLLGNAEYAAKIDVSKSDDTARGSAVSVCWTQDLAPYYMKKFHVVPSREFVEGLVQIYERLIKST